MSKWSYERILKFTKSLKRDYPKFISITALHRAIGREFGYSKVALKSILDAMVLEGLIKQTDIPNIYQLQLPLVELKKEEKEEVPQEEKEAKE